MEIYNFEKIKTEIYGVNTPQRKRIEVELKNLRKYLKRKKKFTRIDNK